MLANKEIIEGDNYCTVIDSSFEVEADKNFEPIIEVFQLTSDHLQFLNLCAVIPFTFIVTLFYQVLQEEAGNWPKLWVAVIFPTFAVEESLHTITVVIVVYSSFHVLVGQSNSFDFILFCFQTIPFLTSTNVGIHHIHSFVIFVIFSSKGRLGQESHFFDSEVVSQHHSQVRLGHNHQEMT